MPKKRFFAILIPICVILFALMIAVTYVMTYYASVMDLILGKGKSSVIAAEGTETWETEYYNRKYDSEEKSYENAMNVSKQIASEGDVLLKNNGVLPLTKNTKVSPMGYRFISPNYGASHGSAAFDTDSASCVSPETALGKMFTLNSTVINAMKSGVVTYMDDSGYETSNKNKMMAKGAIMEYNPDIYNGALSSLNGTVGVVFIGRQAGETYDIPRYTYCDGTVTGLGISKYERETIRIAKENCDKLIVVLNGPHPLQISELMAGDLEADAIIWAAGPGFVGFESLADILCGDVNPSGRTVDLFMADPTHDPTFANYGGDSANGEVYAYTNLAKNTSTSNVSNNFLEYEEGVYNGYRYYETADAVDENYVYGSWDANGKTVIAGEVNYPYGYGLSYTSFTQEITKFDAGGSTVDVTVKVTNTGSVAGKEVVQVYYNAPYTAYDKENKIERPYTVLAGYEKTKEIAAGESDTVTVSFEKEDLAVYSYTHANKDGTTGCYILEAGDYVISLQKNSHEVIDNSNVLSIPSTTYYEGDNLRAAEKEMQSILDDNGNSLNVARAGEYVAVSNQFPDLARYAEDRMTVLSRGNWVNTQPAAPTNFVAPDYVVDVYNNTLNFDPKTDALLGDVEGSLVYNNTAVPEKENNGLVASSLRGVDFDDPTWDELLDNIDYGASDLQNLIAKGYYQTEELAALGLTSSQWRDGPVGITISSNDKSNLGLEQTHFLYPCVPVLAATWNLDLAYEYGEAAAQEALWHNDGNNPINGWYAPCINIHRGPFGARYNEYPCEDPLMSGLIAAATVSGAGDSGLATTIKHFAANNQSEVRDGLNTWMTEQALRELYLRPFQICIRNAKMTVNYISDTDGTVSSKVVRATTGIMTAKNAIGAEWCSTNYALKTSVLRNEWGFYGMVLTDNMANKSDELYSKIIRSGGNIIMETSGFSCPADLLESNTGKNIVREAVHELAYTVVNTSAMQGVAPGGIVHYAMSPWRICLIAGDVIVGALIVAAVVWMVLRDLDEKKHPEKYALNDQKARMIDD